MFDNITRHLFSLAFGSKTLQDIDSCDECIVLKSEYLKRLDVILWLLDHKVKFRFDAEEIDVVVSLLCLNNPTIYNFLFIHYNEYSTTSGMDEYAIPLTEGDVIYVDPTFISLAVVWSLFDLIPEILNTCPIDCLKMPYYWDFNVKSHVIEKYKPENTDIELLEICHIGYTCDDDDPHSEYRYNRMMRALLSLFKIRDGWYNLLCARPPNIKGFHWSGDKLVNPRLAFLVWLGKQKLANKKFSGLPKLLIYQKIYPYLLIF